MGELLGHGLIGIPKRATEFPLCDARRLLTLDLIQPGVRAIYDMLQIDWTPYDATLARALITCKVHRPRQFAPRNPTYLSEMLCCEGPGFVQLLMWR